MGYHLPKRTFITNISQCTIDIVFRFDVKKIIFLVWLVAFQSAVFASFQEPLNSDVSIHCENKDMMMSHDCCQELLTTSHCNTCSQINLTSTATINFVFDDLKNSSTTTFKKAYYSAPVLELFKPPI